MEDYGLKLKILGVRGSFPVSGTEYKLFGETTSCIHLINRDDEIYLDAGTGLVNTMPEGTGDIHFLLSHFHCDHIQGMPAFGALYTGKRNIYIHSSPKEGITAEEAMRRIMSPPLWPLGLPDVTANTVFDTFEDGESFDIGSVRVDTESSNHPNGCTAYRLSSDGKRLAYIVDYEHGTDADERVAEFVRGVDLLIIDSQYTAEEYPRYKGFGHSTPEMGIAMAKKSGVKRVLFAHHAPWRTDEMLLDMEKHFQADFAGASFARIGEEIIL